MKEFETFDEVKLTTEPRSNLGQNQRLSMVPRFLDFGRQQVYECGEFKAQPRSNHWFSMVSRLLDSCRRRVCQLGKCTARRRSNQ